MIQVYEEWYMFLSCEKENGNMEVPVFVIGRSLSFHGYSCFTCNLIAIRTLNTEIGNLPAVGQFVELYESIIHQLINSSISILEEMVQGKLIQLERDLE